MCNTIFYLVWVAFVFSSVAVDGKIPSRPLLTGLEVWKENPHFLIEKGASTPFFVLSDTVWQMPRNVRSQQDAETYFDVRAKAEYNVIQTVAVMVQGQNAEGEYPFGGENHTDVTKINGKYFEPLDNLVNLAQKHGFYVFLWPIWGSSYISEGGMSYKWPYMTTQEESYQYGLFVGKRYKGVKNMVFVIGGDIAEPVSPHDKKILYRTLAEGLAQGYSGLARPHWNNTDDPAWKKILMSLHPSSGHSSSNSWEHDAWLSFNLIQSGWRRQGVIVSQVEGDYMLHPTKPTYMGEGAYEYDRYRYCGDNSPSGQAAGVRLNSYWDMFSGAFGTSYGGSGLWNFSYVQCLPPACKYPRYNWTHALQLPGGNQLKYLKRLWTSLKWMDLKPDLHHQLIPKQYTHSSQNCTLIIGISSSEVALAYTTQGSPVHINMQFASYKAEWYDPRNGEFQPATGVPVPGAGSPLLLRFTPPNKTVALGNDWALLVRNTGT